MVVSGSRARRSGHAILVAFASATIGMALASSCIVLDPDATLCAVGSLDCSCTAGGACDAGLVCDADRCIDPDAPATSTTDVATETSASDDASTTDDDDASSSSDPTAVDDTGSVDAPNVVFVTSTTHAAGSLGGLAGADAICQARADEAGLDGSFVAWLSLDGEDARDRVGDARGWVRPDGRPVATDLAQMLTGVFFHPPVLDEGGVARPGEYAWTGTSADGVASSLDADGICGGWDDAGAGGIAMVGNIGAGTGWWTQWGSQACNAASRLLCLGVDRQFDLAVEPADGRLAFVSEGYIAATAGRDDADAMCQAEGGAVRPGASFLALMADTGTTPAERFDASGPPWVRADGVPIFPDGQPFADLLSAHISLHAGGGASQLAIAWAGAYGASTVAQDADNCVGWTSTTDGSAMFSTYHVGWQAWRLGGGLPECAEPGYPVVCLEL